MFSLYIFWYRCGVGIVAAKIQTWSYKLNSSMYVVLRLFIYLILMKYVNGLCVENPIFTKRSQDVCSTNSK